MSLKRDRKGVSVGDDRESLDVLSRCTFEAMQPEVFFECESAVFAVGNANSLCYTTSVERAELLAAILNEWATFKREADG